MPHLAAAVESLGSDCSFARIYAVFNMTYSLGMIAGPWAIGIVKMRWGFAPGMALITIASILFAPFFFLLGSKQQEEQPPIELGQKHSLSNESTTNLLQQ